MLSLSASHLRALRASTPNKRLVWVDIGGGTGKYSPYWITYISLILTQSREGHNIELMDKHFPVSSFDAIYLVDLCEPLLQIARRRFAKKGWTNITVLCQDASEFLLSEWKDGKEPKGSVGFVTLSYSLSMVPVAFHFLLHDLN